MQRQGDLELTMKCVEAMNAKSDPSEEDFRLQTAGALVLSLLVAATIDPSYYHRKYSSAVDITANLLGRFV